MVIIIGIKLIADNVAQIISFLASPMLFLIPVIQTFNHADNSAGRDHDCFGVIRVISYILRIRERAFSRHINLSIHTYLLYHMNTYDASKKELIFLYFLVNYQIKCKVTE